MVMTTLPTPYLREHSWKWGTKLKKEQPSARWHKILKKKPSALMAHEWPFSKYKYKYKYKYKSYIASCWVSGQVVGCNNYWLKLQRLRIGESLMLPSLLVFHKKKRQTARSGTREQLDNLERASFCAIKSVSIFWYFPAGDSCCGRRKTGWKARR